MFTLKGVKTTCKLKERYGGGFSGKENNTDLATSY
jgi:hypothetical protein